MKFKDILEDAYYDATGETYKPQAEQNPNGALVQGCQTTVRKILQEKPQLQRSLIRTTQNVPNIITFLAEDMEAGRSFGQWVTYGIQETLKGGWTNKPNRDTLKKITESLPLGILSIIEYLKKAIIGYDIEKGKLPSPATIKSWKTLVKEEQMSLASFPKSLMVPVRNTFAEALLPLVFEEAEYPTIPDLFAQVLREAVQESLDSFKGIQSQQLDFRGKCPAYAWLEDIINMVFDLFLASYEQVYQKSDKRLDRTKIARWAQEKLLGTLLFSMEAEFIERTAIREITDIQKNAAASLNAIMMSKSATSPMAREDMILAIRLQDPLQHQMQKRRTRRRIKESRLDGWLSERHPDEINGLTRQLLQTINLSSRKKSPKTISDSKI